MRNKCLFSLGLVFVISLTSMVAFAFSFVGTPADEVDSRDIIVQSMISDEANATPTATSVATTAPEQETEKAERSKIGSMDWDSDDAYRLAKIAMAEAESEDTEGKALVMLVVLNRVWSDEFPDTIEDVIFQKGQFSPISNGRYDEVEPDEDYKTHMETKRICLDDEESKYRLEFMDKSIMGIHDWRASKAAAEMFKGEWKQEAEPNQYGKYDKYYVIADSDREKYIERSILVNMTLLRKTASEKAQTGAILRVIRALLGIKGTYSKAELEKPFVVPTVTFAPDYTDPTVRNGKIVRVHYSCTAENSKALNKATLERELLEDGAFMVWEILPDKIDEFANRTQLENATDPEANLIKYLEEKQVPQERIQELVLKARPIIAEAEASMTATANSGTFEPVEIAVKNYRNYEEETFNFEDITFCTINGQNGAGKSSLFMDAIIDCLYEEPREGVIKDDTGKAPWLRNDESVRSGSIMFTFRIGEKKYRVTRTRARSGKGTLNISQFVENEWKDCSKERYNDTQQEILNILGMDSFTFKSCALIMQDQYGLFLQAKPEERVEVLGTLLGLGVYQLMERIASDKAKVNGAKNRDLKQEITIHNVTIAEFGKPDEELEACKTELAEQEARLQAKINERDQKKLILSNQQEAAERRKKALAAVTTLQAKKTIAEQNRATQQAIADSSLATLTQKPEIEEKIAERNDLLKRELELAGQSALYTTKKQEAENLAKQAESEQKNILELQAALQKKQDEKNAMILDSANDGEVRQKAETYTKKKAELEDMQEKAVAYQKAKTEYSAAVFHESETRSSFDREKQKADEQKQFLEKKVAILNESGCVDIEKAHCKFLQDAIEAKEQLEVHEALYVDIAARRDCELAKSRYAIENKQAEMDAIGYDAAALTVLQNECATLLPYVAQLEKINQRENNLALIKAALEHLKSNISEAENRLAEVKLKGTQAETERDIYAKAFEEHVHVLNAITALDPWVEKEKMLPVAEERNATALNRVLELTAEITGIDDEISERQAEADKEILAMAGMEEAQAIVNGLDTEVNAINSMVKEKQMRIGALQQKSEQIAKLKQDIAALQDKQVEYAKETADYDTLKAAFSQSGVPHQIIRSIIPQLTATANTILGQMTGGKMGVEFRLERLQKNGKEKVSLDIYIEEYGKSILPYLSKSGGEKVKSSLSVILALAEIKSSSAGIQLGMLFIDEPPFLDGDGIQAYCDALETIQSRYNNIKIMAITHDPTMKARFPQNLDVVKTENGSKVIY